MLELLESPVSGVAGRPCRLWPAKPTAALPLLEANPGRLPARPPRSLEESGAAADAGSG